MKKLAVIVALVFLVGCSSSKPKASIDDSSGQMNDKAKTCVTSMSKIADVCYDISVKSSSCPEVKKTLEDVLKTDKDIEPSTVKFVSDFCEIICKSAKGGGSKKDAQTAVESACKEIYK